VYVKVKIIKLVMVKMAVVLMNAVRVEELVKYLVVVMTMPT